MNVQKLFEELGALMHDWPDAAEWPVCAETLTDPGLIRIEIEKVKIELGPRRVTLAEEL